jgi:dienelactone hydrolase
MLTLCLLDVNKRELKMDCTAVAYSDQGVELEAFVACPKKIKSPLVLLCHAWRGRDEFICEKASLIAKQGYVGFALDMYGRGIVGQSKPENAALKKPFMQDRHLLQRRVMKALEVASHLPYVDSKRIAVVGFGFGGICALDLARSGADIKGAVSIYGHFDPPPSHLIKQIRAKVLILHGYLDPTAPQEVLRCFEKEMSEAKVDWQAHIYGNAMHAFVVPTANDADAGLLYNPVAAERAWISVQNFLDEVLA